MWRSCGAQCTSNPAPARVVVPASIDDVDGALVHVQPGVLVDLVLLQLFVGEQLDRDDARSALVRMQDDGLTRLDVDGGEVPDVHGAHAI